MIVKDIETIQKHVATIADGTINFSNIEKFVEASETWLKTYILGCKLYCFVDKHDYESCDFNCHEILLNKIQRIVSLDAFDRAVPNLDLVLTSAGFAVTNNEKVSPASKDRVTALREALKHEAYEAIEDLLVFLEVHVSLHPYWKDSQTYCINNDTFLPTFTIFKRYAAYSEETKTLYPTDRLMFAQLNGKLRSYMQLKIIPAIGLKLYNYILSDQNEENNINVAPESKCRQLLEILRFALANYVLGLTEIAENFVSQALAFLKDNADDFTEYIDINAKFGNAELKDGKIINMC